MTSDRWPEIAIQMENLQRERDFQRRRFESLREKIEEAASKLEGDAVNVLREELAKANMAAGLVTVRGGGESS